MSEPTFTIARYGSTMHLAPDGWVRIETCNAQATDGTPCACPAGHTTPHSWEDDRGWGR